ncbi:hypothetical protein VTI74DRAFT_2271 [Chaetomium olivicolor]
MESFAAFYLQFEKQLTDINYLRKTLNEEMKDLLVLMLHLLADYLGFIQELYLLGANVDV